MAAPAGPRGPTASLALHGTNRMVQAKVTYQGQSSAPHNQMGDFSGGRARRSSFGSPSGGMGGRKRPQRVSTDSGASGGSSQTRSGSPSRGRRYGPVRAAAFGSLLRHAAAFSPGRGRSGLRGQGEEGMCVASCSQRRRPWLGAASRQRALRQSAAGSLQSSCVRHAVASTPSRPHRCACAVDVVLIRWPSPEMTSVIGSGCCLALAGWRSARAAGAICRSAWGSSTSPRCDTQRPAVGFDPVECCVCVVPAAGFRAHGLCIVSPPGTWRHGRLLRGVLSSRALASDGWLWFCCSCALWQVFALPNPIPVAPTPPMRYDDFEESVGSPKMASSSPKRPATASRGGLAPDSGSLDMSCAYCGKVEYALSPPLANAPYHTAT